MTKTKEENEIVDEAKIEEPVIKKEAVDEIWVTSDGIIGKSRDEVIEKVNKLNK